jgi:glycerophosphoryl diester phosphodiesterase
VLDLVEQRVALNIELKSADGTAVRVAEELVDAVSRGWDPAAFLVSSFHLPELDLFRERAPSIPVAVLLCGVPLDYAACASELGAVALNLSLDFVDPKLVADARARGLELLVYTVNEPSEVVRLHAMGIDGVFTDYPERARAALNAIGEV